jgi:hypothetical protein
MIVEAEVKEIGKVCKKKRLKRSSCNSAYSPRMADQVEVHRSRVVRRPPSYHIAWISQRESTAYTSKTPHKLGTGAPVPAHDTARLQTLNLLL